MTELATEINPTAPLQSRPAVIDWQGFTPDTSRADARAAFWRKFGYQAAKIIITAGAVLAGPIEKGEHDG